jgi:crotonobetainyl-CoA:carnitine CoA-transferase CaiB-like acyl-CoA transferase
MIGALDGLLVVDLSRILAGPYCTMILGDLGARVIKIESPGSGDDTRGWGPPFVNGESAYFLSVNRNKESVTLNLKHPEAAEVLGGLIDRADILVENFRPGTLGKLGFGYDDCRARRPGLIYTSISGYGRTGPESGRLCYDLIAQAEGGVMSLTGEEDGPPLKTGVSQADIVTGMWALNGILAALYVRERTGLGQHVDVALLDGQVGLLGYHATSYFSTGRVPHRKGNRHPTLTPYEVFAAADGSVVVAVASETQWRAFCAAIGQPDLAADPRFLTNTDRVAFRADLEAVLKPAMATRSVAGWIEALSAAGVPAGAVRNVEQVLTSEQVRARGMVVTVEHPRAGSLKLTGTPVQLSETPGRPRRPPPLLGEHTESVLTEVLGYSPEKVADLRRDGAI